MHNIESDYGLNIYKKSKNLSNYIRYYSYRVNEKKVMAKVDYVIFLTKNDVERAKNLYKVKYNQMYINPVCIETSNKFYLETQCKNENISKFLMTGTLNYGSNVDGIVWFLENVWIKKFRDKSYSLTIAGAHPNEELKNIISKNKNVYLIDTPNDMTEYFLNADCYIAPIFDGAGMKVKVAEALSYGLPVIGTTHAFIGYENISYGKYLANTTKEFVSQIEECATNNINKEAIYNEFNSKLSMNHSKEFYNKMIVDLKNCNGQQFLKQN